MANCNHKGVFHPESKVPANIVFEWTEEKEKHIRRINECKE